MAEQKEQGELPDGIRSRPKLPKEYGLPSDDQGLLPWEWVVERLEKAQNYWVCTSGSDGRPHAMPIWAIWAAGTLYFDGHPNTRWGRNITHNPAMTVHLESGNEVVILEGTVESLESVERPVAEEIVAVNKAKYPFSPTVDELVGRGLYALRPKVVLAWSEFPKTMTRWRFGDE